MLGFGDDVNVRIFLANVLPIRNQNLASYEFNLDLKMVHVKCVKNLATVDKIY